MTDEFDHTPPDRHVDVHGSDAYTRVCERLGEAYQELTEGGREGPPRALIALLVASDELAGLDVLSGAGVPVIREDLPGLVTQVDALCGRSWEDVKYETRDYRRAAQGVRKLASRIRRADAGRTIIRRSA